MFLMVMLRSASVIMQPTFRNSSFLDPLSVRQYGLPYSAQQRLADLRKTPADHSRLSFDAITQR